LLRLAAPGMATDHLASVCLALMNVQVNKGRDFNYFPADKMNLKMAARGNLQLIAVSEPERAGVLKIPAVLTLSHMREVT